MQFGGIVLCGGHSGRMGSPKALLPFGDEVLLQCVVRVLLGAVQPVVVVAAAEQPLPALPEGVRVVVDQHQDRGPLEGLLAGLSALAGEVDAVYVSSCDVPFLSTTFIQRMLAELGEHAIAAPYDEQFARRGYCPLAAVYRTSVLPSIAAQLAADRLRLTELLEQADTRRVPLALLREVDPELHSLLNCNTPAEYEAALKLVDLTSGSPRPASGRGENEIKGNEHTC